MKALVGAFNQEKALVGAFSVIVQPVVEPMDRCAALLSILSGCCLTLPEGEDLDQVIVGSGRFRHRQLFEKAYRVGNLIGR